MDAASVIIFIYFLYIFRTPCGGYVLFPTRGKEPKGAFKGTPLEEPRIIGKNPMIFTELNRKIRGAKPRNLPKSASRFLGKGDVYI